MLTLVLSSTSVFRRQVLDKLQLPYETVAPQVDETPLFNESPRDLVERLSKAKALAAGSQFPNALIIGSDQVAVLNDTIIGKPLTYSNAFRQLKNASGKKVEFFTGLCLHNSEKDRTQVACVPFSVYFRHLSDERINRYLEKDHPYNSAGSFKSEGLGITLFERMVGDDPNALIGLPLIELVRMLETEGVHIP